MKVNHKTRRYFQTARMLKELGVALTFRHKGRRVPIREAIIGPKRGLATETNHR